MVHEVFALEVFAHALPLLGPGIRFSSCYITRCRA